MWRDPEPLAEAHGAEILEPLALPRAVLHPRESDALSRNSQRGGEPTRRGGTVRVRREQSLHTRCRPEAEFTGRGLENGIVAHVCERDRRGTALEARRLGGIRIQLTQLEAQLDERKRHGLASAARGGARDS